MEIDHGYARDVSEKVSGSPSRSFSAAALLSVVCPNTRFKDLIASKNEDRLPPRRPHRIGVSFLLAGNVVELKFKRMEDKKSQVKGRA